MKFVIRYNKFQQTVVSVAYILILSYLKLISSVEICQL